MFHELLDLSDSIPLLSSWFMESVQKRGGRLLPISVTRINQDLRAAPANKDDATAKSVQDRTLLFGLILFNPLVSISTGESKM